ncbi:glycosyltransferase family 2 protein [Flavobacterium pedocola]
MQPFISIIIPTFNRANLIGETLDSIVEQTHADWECILVDDGSTDNSREVIETYLKKDSRFRYFERPSDRKKGANACRNYGFEQSKGAYVKWFDSDDVLLPDALEKQLEVLKETGKQIAVCEYHLFRNRETENIVPQYLNEKVTNLFLTYISGDITLNTQIVLFSRDVVEGYLFDESLSRAQDLDFIYRILKDHNAEVVLQNEVLVQIRAHSDSITGTFHKGNLSALNSEIRVRQHIFNDNYNNPQIPQEVQQRVLVTCLNSFRALLLNGYYQEYRSFMRDFKKKLSFQKKWKINVLLGIASLYKRTGKGIYIYGKIAKKI